MHLQNALEGLALNPALSAAMVRRLIAHDAVGTRPDLTPEVVDEMIATGRPRLLRQLTMNESLPGSSRLRLARHSDTSVRAGVAAGCVQGTSREVVELLLADLEPEPRRHLVRNSAVPDDLRARLATDPSAQVRAELAGHWPAAPEHVRRTLLTDPDATVREAACSTHQAPPPDLVPALLADPVTRAGTIRHLTLGDATAHRLSQDPDPDVRAELAVAAGAARRARRGSEPAGQGRGVRAAGHPRTAAGGHPRPGRLRAPVVRPAGRRRAGRAGGGGR
ncbi:hypothetical protein [Lentzea sp. HUAS12]|uniref:hypothetical protein n=1 Tax=Lentzea sp. HUAS12 TaxID=2951806 RepID=UPI0020A21771|nr:hypothetical protein [Lentzea sp. HUAS12]USX54259.1 hypothetical protein ND450_09205 [Lentzea sp. HUAS12]